MFSRAGSRGLGQGKEGEVGEIKMCIDPSLRLNVLGVTKCFPAVNNGLRVAMSPPLIQASGKRRTPAARPPGRVLHSRSRTSDAPTPAWAESQVKRSDCTSASEKAFQQGDCRSLILQVCATVCTRHQQRWFYRRVPHPPPRPQHTRPVQCDEQASRNQLHLHDLAAQ